MKVAVFGGSGFLGSHVADALSDAGYEVRIIDVVPSAYPKAGQEMMVGDILNPGQVLEAVDGCRYVYNFAGFADLNDARTKPIDTIRLNVESVANILEACRKKEVERFIYASTIYVYSNKGGFYRCSKQAAEIYIEEFHNRYGINFSVLRYGTLYGPRADKTNSIFRYLSQAMNEKKIVAPGSGEELREYIHVRDAAQLNVKILDKEFKNKHLIITGHHPIKLSQLLGTIREVLNNECEIEYKPGTNPAHYAITPYSFIPKIGKKLTTDCYTDIGQGLLECIHEMYTDGLNGKAED